MDYNISGKHTYSFPTTIRFGGGVIEEVANHLNQQGLKNPLVVTDATVAQIGFFQDFVRQLEHAGLSVVVYDKMHKNPVKSDVLAGGEVYHDSDSDCIIGIGGGVAMDVARAICLRINHHRDLFDYDDLEGGDQYITEEVPYFITIPTTSGTGSEVGRSAIIAENETKRKRILYHPKLMAKIVFADPMLTMDLPPHITAATGMDAFTHNIEAYLAKDYNPMCDGIALEGIGLITQSIEKASLTPNLESRSMMMLGSLMGAVAFQKGLGIVHSLAHPLSSLLDTHHGLANAVNLPYGMAFNYEGCEKRFDTIGFHMGLGENQGSKVVEAIQKLNASIGMPSRLSEIGVKAEHIPILSDLAFKDFCHPNNPKPVSKYNFEELYTKAL